jgi:hypothetical protein
MVDAAGRRLTSISVCWTCGANLPLPMIGVNLSPKISNTPFKIDRFMDENSVTF